MTDPKLAPERVRDIAKTAIRAWMAEDGPGVTAAIQPIFSEGTPADCWVLLIDLIVFAHGAPDEGHVYMPVIGHLGPDGKVVTDSIDDQELGVQVYARMSAAVVGHDFDSAAAHFRLLIENESPAPLSSCLWAALAQAGHRVRAAVAHGYGFPQ